MFHRHLQWKNHQTVRPLLWSRKKTFRHYLLCFTLKFNKIMYLQHIYVILSKRSIKHSFFLYNYDCIKCIKLKIFNKLQLFVSITLYACIMQNVENYDSFSKSFVSFFLSIKFKFVCVMPIHDTYVHIYID